MSKTLWFSSQNKSAQNLQIGDYSSRRIGIDSNGPVFTCYRIDAFDSKWVSEMKVKTSYSSTISSSNKCNLFGF